ncbi:hypothetical protein ACFVY1_25700 [Streptomyces sp. NPDC058293]|uniref:hypothetical protein n=1 Tax=Streptomyces sp. NPDC058293 TaxID=3346429 RepID=UPI0036E615B6
MTKTNRAHASTSNTSTRHHGMPAPMSWPRLAATALFAGAARHVGSLLAGLAVAWWHHD